MDEDDFEKGFDVTPDKVRLIAPPLCQQVSKYNGNGSDNTPDSLPTDNLEDGTSCLSYQTQDISRNGVYGSLRFCRCSPFEPLDESTDAGDKIYERVFPQQRRQASNGTNYYKSEENRLLTFTDWHYQRVARKEDLAKNGFVFTGAGDKVRCVFCNGLLRQWETGDIVEREHQRNFSSCPFVLGENVGNIPLQPSINGYHTSDSAAEQGAFRNVVSTNDQHDSITHGMHGSSGNNLKPAGHTYSTNPQNPGMAVEQNRLDSFAGWPAQMRQRPEDLARAGLYYAGDGDKVKCFHCGVGLFNWDPKDDPFEEHAKWFPDCQFIRLLKGEDFVRNAGNVEEQEDVMQMPAVQAVLFDGYNEQSLRKAVDTLRHMEGPSAEVTAQKLLLILMKEDFSPPSLFGSINSHRSSPEGMETLQQENESLRDKQLCKICMERDVEVIFYPCKHIVCCASCSVAVSACPICRVHIQGTDKIFMV